MAKGELLEKAACQVIPPQEGAVAIAVDAIIGHQDTDEIGMLFRPLLLAGEEQRLFVGREDKLAFGQLLGQRGLGESSRIDSDQFPARCVRLRVIEAVALRHPFRLVQEAVLFQQDTSGSGLY